MRVALLAGCAQRVLANHINQATIRLLCRHGCEVVIAPGAVCCGALTYHMGKEERARAAARACVDAWTRELDGDGLDAVVVNASGCGSVVKDYRHLFQSDPAWAAQAARIGAIALDVTELLTRLELQPPKAPRAYPIAYHDACSLQHVQKVINEPRRLLRKAGFDVRDVPEKHFCCGSAGTYNLLQPRIADDLGKRKAANIEHTGAAIIAAGNLGCLEQIARHTPLPVVHSVELLDWATGGPMPPALAGIALPPPFEVTRVETAAPAIAPSATDGTAIW